jgi:hypothetical protein
VTKAIQAGELERSSAAAAGDVPSTDGGRTDVPAADRAVRDGRAVFVDVSNRR